MARRDILAVRAKEIVAYMQEKYSEEIEESVKNTKLYSPDSVFNVTSTIRGIRSGAYHGC